MVNQLAKPMDLVKVPQLGQRLPQRPQLLAIQILDHSLPDRHTLTPLIRHLEIRPRKTRHDQHKDTRQNHQLGQTNIPPLLRLLVNTPVIK